jgi:hypothetical protein
VSRRGKHNQSDSELHRCRGGVIADHMYLQDVNGGVMKVAAGPDGSLLVQGSVQGAQLHIQSLPGWEDTPWSEGEA